MKLLNVFFFGVSGIIGLKVLLTMLSRLEEAQSPQAALQPAAAPTEAGGSPSQPAAAPTKRSASSQERSTARSTFQVWVVIYALVGAQMGWILRPFIGSPELPFQWFRGREANIFVDIIRTIGKLLGL